MEDGVPATAGGLANPYGVFIDGAGDLYIAERYNHRIRKVDASGVITTVAGNGNPEYSGDGGPATEAGLRYPRGVFVDGDGYLYIADTGNHRVVQLEVVGNGRLLEYRAHFGESGYEGTDTDHLYTPIAVAAGEGHLVYVLDAGNKRLMSKTQHQNWTHDRPYREPDVKRKSTLVVGPGVSTRTA